jgi:hypothetical protein
MLNDAIFEILTEKRKSDKINMELEDMVQSRGRYFTDEMVKKRQKHEERKLRIGKEQNLENLIKQYDILSEKTADEEQKSRDILKEKLDLEEELLVINQELKDEQDKSAFNREELIRLRVKDSQLDSQGVMLKIESE